MSQPPHESANWRKHHSRNPLKGLLVRRFGRAVSRLAAASLDGLERPLVLDAGCGEGLGLSRLAASLPQARLLGVDKNPSALSLARASHNGDLLLADVCRLPFADDSFDLAVCLEVLEHVQEPSMGMSELARVTRGRVLMSVPNQPYFALSNLALGRNLRHLGDDPDHRHAWRGRTFASAVSCVMPLDGVCYSFPWVVVVARGASTKGSTSA